MKTFLQPLQNLAEMEEIQKQAKKNRGILEISGCMESQKAHLMYGLSGLFPCHLVIATDEKSAKELYEDYRFYDKRVYYYPAKDELIADTARTHGDWMGDTLLAWAETLQRDTDAHKAMKSLLHELLWDEMHAKLHVVLVSHAAIAGGELSALMDAMRKKWALMLEVGSLKLQSNDARTIRARSGAFFSMLIGYMAKAEITDADIDEFIEIFLSR